MYTSRQKHKPQGVKMTEYSSIPESLWLTDGTTGYLPPNLLMPDPKQPRLAIGENGLEELVDSIRSAGVREVIRITPLACTPWVPATSSQFRFLIVSGHRRTEGALKAEMPLVPVLIRVYESEQDHRDDADLLNIGRKDLTPYEEAVEIKRRRDLGETWEKVASKRGMSTMHCQMRLKLLNLAPEIRDLINPVARSGKRSDFPINLAQAIGGITTVTPENFLAMIDRYGFTREDIELREEEDMLSFALQRAILAHIQAEGMSAGQGVEFVANGKVVHRSNNRQSHGAQASRGPEKLRRTLKAGLGAVHKASITSLTNTLVRAACADQPDLFIDQLLDEAKKSMTELERVTGILRSIKDRRAAAPALPAQRFTPAPIRTLADMTPEERAAIAQKYQ